MELTPFPSDFGTFGKEASMVEWDHVVPMDNLFSQMFTKVREAYAKLPDAPHGWKWDLVTQNDEPIYNRTDKELSLHFALVKERII